MIYHTVMFSWIWDGVAVHSAAGALCCLAWLASIKWQQNGNAGQQIGRSAAA